MIKTETTPNPHSLKYIPQGKIVLPEEHGTGMQFDRSNTALINRSKLVKMIYTLKGIKSIFLAKDFISITKENDAFWKELKPAVFSKIMDFYQDEDAKVIDDATEEAVSDTAILDTDSEVVATIKELMESKIRPSVQEDGGDIFFVGFDEVSGMVQVRLAGSCVGCPSSSVTLRNGVEKMLMHYIPEVKGSDSKLGSISSLISILSLTCRNRGSDGGQNRRDETAVRPSVRREFDQLICK
jgi:Fe-S cluster biogenesis protein NfuA